ncbi:hypothetical protein Tco_0117407 [Tanacetum coccineum]
MGDGDPRTIPEKESDKVIMSSVEDLVPIPSESEETFDNDSECDLPFCGDSSPLDVLGEKNFKTYSNPLFEFDDRYISSDVNLLFNEVLEDIESKDSYIEACLTSDSIPPEIDGADFDSKGDILLLKKLLNNDISFHLRPKELHFEGLKLIKSYIPLDFEDDYYDSERDTIYLKSLLINDNNPNLLPEVFFDHNPKSLNDEPDNDDLKNMIKDFPDYEDSRARGFVYCSLDLQFLACLYMGI